MSASSLNPSDQASGLSGLLGNLSSVLADTYQSFTRTGQGSGSSHSGATEDSWTPSSVAGGVVAPANMILMLAGARYGAFVPGITQDPIGDSEMDLSDNTKIRRHRVSFKAVQRDTNKGFEHEVYDKCFEGALALVRWEDHAARPGTKRDVNSTIPYTKQELAQFSDIFSALGMVPICIPRCTHSKALDFWWSDFVTRKVIEVSWVYGRDLDHKDHPYMVLDCALDTNGLLRRIRGIAGSSTVGLTMNEIIVADEMAMLRQVFMW